MEIQYGLNPDKIDSTGDGLKDAEKIGYWGDKFEDDCDSDNITNLLDPDADNDGYPNGLEIAMGTDPCDPKLFPILEQSFIAGLGTYPSNENSLEVFKTNYLHAFNLSVDWPEYNILNGEARIATGDIDGDKKDEVIIGLGPVEGEPTIPGGRFLILDDNYKQLSWGQIDWPEYNSANGESWPACGDVDGDGKDEIVIGLGIGGNGKIEVFDFEGGKAAHKAWIEVGWNDYCKAGGGVRPACGNIDFDRKDEIILGLYPIESIFMSEGKFEVLDDSYRHLAWGLIDWPEYIALNGEAWPACGDTSQNARDEILIGLGKSGGGRIEVFNYLLGEVVNKRWIETGSKEYKEDIGETRISCGDIDLDYKDEILVGFGQEGGGEIELLDDAISDYTSLAQMRLSNEEYVNFNGQIYPAIKSIKQHIPWVVEVLLKSLAEKRLRQLNSKKQ